MLQERVEKTFSPQSAKGRGGDGEEGGGEEERVGDVEEGAEVGGRGEREQHEQKIYCENIFPWVGKRGGFVASPKIQHCLDWIAAMPEVTHTHTHTHMHTRTHKHTHMHTHADTHTHTHTHIKTHHTFLN